MKKSLLVILIAILTCAMASAQYGSIRGTLTDSETLSPVRGATIMIPSKVSDLTDEFGGFYIRDINPGQYDLTITHVGYETHSLRVEVKASAVSSLNISLRKNALDLSELKLSSKRKDPLNQVDIMLRPVNNSQDILRIVPGLFIGQHAGGGKAEQIFLRGYDIDHGTDLSITVDGMPVNMVSHAHGQGYADLHFLIPETVGGTKFEMGPYSTSRGNFATAGFVDFQTKEFITDNLVKAEAGDFNTYRVTTMLKLFEKRNDEKSEQLYTAAEYMKTDGFVESPQDFHRFNAFLKYSNWKKERSGISITASAFDSKWNASGQIPERGVTQGIISRFGSIDDTEGGTTSRYNINSTLSQHLKNDWSSETRAWFSHYRFRLYSNFTFFLNDAVNGDQIRQSEKRNLYGVNQEFRKKHSFGKIHAASRFGAGFRMDDVRDVELSSAVKRNFLDYKQRGDIKELNLGGYYETEIHPRNDLQVIGGIRADHFRFHYIDRLSAIATSSKRSKTIVSPKLNVAYSPSARFSVFLNNGIGFHSNDTRVITSGSADKIIPKVYGTDAGITWKPVKDMLIKTVFWHLYSEQEFVYVGDEGVVEPSGKSRRMGVDFSMRYQLLNWLYADADMNLTKARAIEEEKGKDYIPLAPSFTSIGGLTAKLKNGISTSLRYRFMDDRPADEENIIKAKGYFISDFLFNWKIKNIEFHFSLENIFNEEWNEAQFNTTSRLFNEPAEVTELHYTPGTPRYFKAGISFTF